jgi:hypothetical protein
MYLVAAVERLAELLSLDEFVAEVDEQKEGVDLHSIRL